MPPADSLLPDLMARLTPARRRRLTAALDGRTRRVCVALEGLRQEHNFSAVMRSCDAFGVQDVHLLDADDQFAINREVALGAQKWLTIRRHESAAACLASLRSRGYRIVATSPHEPATPLPELDVSQPIALLLGNELHGLPPERLEQADERVAIPMAGLVESFNVSVAAAICLYDITRRVRLTAGWPLPEGDREILLGEWVRASIRNVEAIEEELRRRAE